MFQALPELLLLFLLVGAMAGVPGVGAASALPSGCTPHFSPCAAVSGTPPPSENLPALTMGIGWRRTIHPSCLLFSTNNLPHVKQSSKHWMIAMNLGGVPSPLTEIESKHPQCTYQEGP